MAGVLLLGHTGHRQYRALPQIGRDRCHFLGSGEQFPHLFNATIQIRIALADRQPVRVSVYDALGRWVAVPLHAILGAGTHAVPIQAGGCASGLYSYRVGTPAGSVSDSMVLVR